MADSPMRYRVVFQVKAILPGDADFKVYQRHFTLSDVVAVDYEFTSEPGSKVAGCCVHLRGVPSCWIYESEAERFVAAYNDYLVNAK